MVAFAAKAISIFKINTFLSIEKIPLLTFPDNARNNDDAKFEKPDIMGTAQSLTWLDVSLKR